MLPAVVRHSYDSPDFSDLVLVSEPGELLITTYHLFISPVKISPNRATSGQLPNQFKHIIPAQVKSPGIDLAKVSQAHKFGKRVARGDLVHYSMIIAVDYLMIAF
jgi:hypothetical protein